jgi:glucose-6-phosphate isomerase
MQELKLDISRAKASAVGSEHGVTPAELRDAAARIEKLHKALQADRRKKTYGFWDLYKDRPAINEVKRAAKDLLKNGYENLVVLGIGGSALGTTALATALKPPYYNLLSNEARKGCSRLFVMDNIDPDTFDQMLTLCPPEKTLFNVVSKSGGTAETMSQLLIVMKRLEDSVGANALARHLVVTTNPRGKDVPPSLLHDVVDEYKLTEFSVPLNVGGRFSVFSPVGLFPAAMLGMDIDGLIEGCAAMDKRTSHGDMETNPAYLHAAVQYLMDTKKGKSISVMMPYADSLRDVADWYRQLWAESLGKRFGLDQSEVFTGQTPVKALGATDQHSQVQLYREGPNDKVFNILEVGSFAKRLTIPKTLTFIKEIEYLRGKTMNKLMAAELRGTMDALKASKRPVCRITLPAVTASSVAQLLYMLEVETAMAGRLYNVNAFDQPGVEEGKHIAEKLMGKKA